VHEVSRAAARLLILAIVGGAPGCGLHPLDLGSDLRPQAGGDGSGFVQAAAPATSPSAASTISVTLPTATTAGDLVVVAATWGDDSALLWLPTAVDDHGTPLALAVRDFEPQNSQSLALFYVANVAGGVSTITVQFNAPGYGDCGPPSANCSPNGAELFRHIVAAEYRGVSPTAPLLTSAQHVFSGGCAANHGIYTCPGSEVASSGDANVSVPGALILGVTVNASGDHPDRTPGTGYTLRAIDPWDGVTTFASLLSLQDRIATTAGPFASTENFSTSEDYIAAVVVFAPAPL
jgi:hypothetical protein